MPTSSLLRAAFVAALATLALPVVAQQAARPAAATGQQTSASAAAPVAQAAPGTFQLVRMSQKVTVALTTESLTEIERRRDDTQEVSWLLNSYARVRILPRSVINAPGFKPVAPVVETWHK